MKIIEKKLGCALLEPTLIRDVRGWFQVPFSIEELQTDIRSDKNKTAPAFSEIEF